MYAVNVAPAEVPPPGVGLKTVTSLLPSETTSVAPISAFSCELFTNVVGRSDPFQRTTDVGTKSEPCTASVNAAPPKDVPPGDKEVRVGCGFGVTAMVTALDASVPGLLTVIESVPIVVRPAAGMVNPSC